MSRLAALAFKIATDPFVGRLCFTRAYSGKLEQVLMYITQEHLRKREFLEFSKCMRINKIKFLH